jgi:hypothetical protein
VKISYTVQADAVRSHKDAKIVWDCGVIRIRKDEWLVLGETLFACRSLEEIGATIVSDEPNSQLTEAIDSGHY